MIIDRYIANETLRPFAVGLALLLIVFIGYSSAIRLSEAADGVILPATVTQLILLNTLIALEVMLPTALYLSVLSAVSRLYRDSEMAALRASGIGEWRVIWAVAKPALLIAALVGTISMFGRPWAYHQTYAIEAQAESGLDTQDLEAGQFISLRNGQYTLFARSFDRERERLGEVFLVRRDGPQSRVIFAKEAQISSQSDAPRRLTFHDGYAYLLYRSVGRDMSVHFKSLVVHLQDQSNHDTFHRKAEPTDQLALSRKPKDIAEYQWRLSTPLLTMALAILAVPFSRTGPKHSRFSNFFYAILFYVVLFNFTNMVRSWVEQDILDRLPGLWLIFSLPAILLVFMLWPRHPCGGGD